MNTSWMEQWSILSNVINYVQYNRSHIDYFKLEVKALEPKNHKRIYEHLEQEDRDIIGLEFGETPEN